MIGAVSLLMPLLVAALTVTIVQRAMATNIAPSVGLINFSLANNTASMVYYIPPDHPALLIGNTTTSGDRGTGFVSLERASGSFIEWTGLNSVSGGGPPTITGGYSNLGGGVRIVQIDYYTSPFGVYVEAAPAPNYDGFIIKNEGTVLTVTGQVMYFY